MKIVQLNISGALKYAGSSPDDYKVDGSILTAYIKWFKDLSPDVICLQEAHSDDANGSNSQAEQIAQALGYNFFNTALSESHLESGKFLSLAILTKLEIKAPEFIILKLGLYFPKSDGSLVPEHDKGVQRVHLSQGAKTFTLCNVHFPYARGFKRDVMEDEFKPVRAALARILLEESGNEIICGDFNSHGYNLDHIFPELFTKDKLAESFNVKTTTPNGYYQLDHVLYSPQKFDVESYSLQEVGSDHLACIVDIADK